MVQDDSDETAEAAVPKRRYLLLAGVAVACLLGAGLGLWARPALSERGETVAVAPERLPAGDRKLQIVFDDTPPPAGQPLEVLRSPPPSAAPPSQAATSIQRAAGQARLAPAPTIGPAVAPTPGPSLVDRARPVAREIIASAEAALLRIAEIRSPAPSSEPSPDTSVHDAASSPPHASHKVQTASAKAARQRTAAQRLAHLEAKKAAARARAAEEARIEAAAEARAERIAAREEEKRRVARLAEKARAEAVARAERREAGRLAAAQRARAQALAEARAEARAKALQEARAEARAKALQEARAEARARALQEAQVEAAVERRRRRMAVLAHAPAKTQPHRPRPAEPPPPAPHAPLHAPRVIQASAPSCVSADPGAALACADPQLTAADRRMNRAYQQAQAAGVPEAELRRQQQRWLAARAAAAREAPWAVRDVYQARIAELEDMARTPRN